MADGARQFRFIRPIAAGGFGTVYLCKEEHADGFSRVVAVKILNAQWTDSEEVSSRLRDEARLLGLLRHRNIVDVYDLTSIDGRSAVVMEYLEAIDLRYLMQQCQSRSVRMPVRVALEIVSQVGQALDAAYNRPPMKGENPLRVIHRDIKPSNIMLDGHGLTKVLDFGVAQSDIVSKEADTQDLQFGSVDYMAPERLFFEPETPASDVYSLAATLYELLTFERMGKAQGRASKHDAHLANRMSFMRGSIEASPQVAASVEALLLRSLHFEHEHRPDAATFAQDAKQIARTIDALDLSLWAEAKVPLVVEESQRRALNVEPLSHSILVEDYAEPLLSEEDETQDDQEAVEEPLMESETPRAAALRRGALAELESSSDVPISPSTGAPRDGLHAQMTDRTDGEGWDDRTMGDLTDARGELNASRPLTHLPLTRPQPFDEVPRGAGEIEIAATNDAEHSVTEVPHYDTMEGLSPVRPRPSMLWLALGALLPLVLALLLGGFIVFQDMWGVRSALHEIMAGEDTLVVKSGSTAKPPKVSQNEALELADDLGIRFVSAWESTAKLKVHCKEESAAGSREAVLMREAASRCAVTAIGTDRSRLKKVVEVATVGTWICFEDGVEQCRVE
jgi:serine/threonine protein kinase